MSTESNYHISFFKPTTERAKKNRNVVILLVSIWTVAIFGFHFLLKAIEKPTPEPELIAFNEVWGNVKTNSASTAETKTFAHSALHVAGKVFIKTEHRAALDNGITWATFALADSAQKIALSTAISDFEKLSAEANSVTDEAYISAKTKLAAIAQQVLELDPSSAVSKILPLELKSSVSESLNAEDIETIETVMPLYMVHNRSVLTDTKFLGFPFHYFYTAVFLLILFVGLCFAYCVLIDKNNKELGIAE